MPSSVVTHVFGMALKTIALVFSFMLVATAGAGAHCSTPKVTSHVKNPNTMLTHSTMMSLTHTSSVHLFHVFAIFCLI